MALLFITPTIAQGLNLGL